MHFSDAVNFAKQGWGIRHSSMGPGWVFIWQGGHLWARNPSTGSLTAQLRDSDRERADWSKVKI